jgi:hypothetical protein
MKCDVGEDAGASIVPAVPKLRIEVSEACVPKPFLNCEARKVVASCTKSLNSQGGVLYEEEAATPDGY